MKYLTYAHWRARWLRSKESDFALKLSAGLGFFTDIWDTFIAPKIKN